jgi:hypothetical protein
MKRKPAIYSTVLEMLLFGIIVYEYRPSLQFVNVLPDFAHVGYPVLPAL